MKVSTLATSLVLLAAASAVHAAPVATVPMAQAIATAEANVAANPSDAALQATLAQLRSVQAAILEKAAQQQRRLTLESQTALTAEADVQSDGTAAGRSSGLGLGGLLGLGASAALAADADAGAGANTAAGSAGMESNLHVGLGMGLGLGRR